MAKRPWRPILLSVVGLGGLLSSWACFPPIPLAGGPSNPSGIMVAPQPQGTGSPVPEGSPPASAQPSAAASAATFPALAPAVGRTYTYRTTGAAPGRLLVEVTEVDGERVRYRSQSQPETGLAPAAVDGEVTRANGAFWIFADRPSPLTADVSTFPIVDVTVPAGSGRGFEVKAGADTYWFVEGIIVKAVTAAGTTELEAVR